LIFNAQIWQAATPNRWSSRAAAIARGLLIAIPLLIIFGGLFVAADAAFEQLIHSIFNWNLDEVFQHLCWMGFWSWLSIAFLRQLFLVEETPTNAAAQTGWSLGTLEIGTILGLLNVLFFAFVIIQFRYLFGGAELVRASTGLTYSEYARRGFFELVTVAALVLPTLLVAHHLFQKNPTSSENVFRVLAGTLIALLFVIMYSALLRMRLYSDEYGLTELRLYTTAFMGWLAIVFVWFMLTVLRGQRERFVFGSLIAGFGVLLVLNLINPDALIVHTNVSRAHAPEITQAFDAGYVLHLSADAVPPLIEAWSTLPAGDRCQVAADILYNWSPPQHFDWRTWNWSRVQAWWAVHNNTATLQAACP
jgi:hypothetical protein